MKKINPETTAYFRQINSGRENKFFLLLFLVVVCGGAIRKWVTDNSALSNLVLFVQIIIPFAMFLFKSSTAESPFKSYPILYFYFGYLAFHIIYPLQVTIYHGMIGLIIYGLFWIGAFFYLANRRLFNPAHYLPFILVVVAIEIFLAFIQYSLPYNHVLNRYSDPGTAVAVVSDKVRVSGTFSYLSGYTAFLLFYPFFTWSLIRKNYSTWIVAFATTFGLIASFMTGSRSGTALYLAFSGVLLVQSYSVSDLGKVIFRLLIPATVALMVLLLAKKVTITDQIVTAYKTFSNRVTENRERGEESQRLAWDFTYFEGDKFKYPVLGIGTGSTYQGATQLFGVSPYALEFGYVESEFVKIILEGGIILLFFRIALATILILYIRLPSSLIKFLTWFSLIYAAPVVFNVHNACFLLMGIILVDNIVWRQEVESQYNSIDSENEPVLDIKKLNENSAEIITV